MSMMKRHVAALVARRNRETADDPDACPKCGAPIQEQWSGVKCSSPDCTWWFCY